MPTATLEDDDFKKLFQSQGYNANVIISKSIDEDGNVKIVWKHG